MSGLGARDRVDILGVGVDRVCMHSAVTRVEELLAAGGRHQVVVLSVDSIMAAQADRRFRGICREASLVVPDGMPILWASRLLGKPIPGRVAGPDLMRELSALAAHKGWTCFFLGSTPAVLRRLSETLSHDHPGLRIAGAYAPPVSAEIAPETDEEIARRVNSVHPDILWVAMGMPKQEKWIHGAMRNVEAGVFIGVGGAFDMCSGSVKRAPLWMQKTGLEWFHRFLMEPGRLFARYFIKGLPFFPLLFMQRLKMGRHARRGGDTA